MTLTSKLSNVVSLVFLLLLNLKCNSSCWQAKKNGFEMFYSIFRVSVRCVCDQSITVKLYLTVNPIEKLSDQSITLKWKVMECLKKEIWIWSTRFVFDFSTFRPILYNVDLIKQERWNLNWCLEKLWKNKDGTLTDVWKMMKK
jgi:uncharacterized protein YukJ